LCSKLCKELLLKYLKTQQSQILSDEYVYYTDCGNGNMTVYISKFTKLYMLMHIDFCINNILYTMYNIYYMMYIYFIILYYNIT
jgi:hypothetical protein